MSPIVFLVIPLVVFALGSAVLMLGSRLSGGGAARRAPADLRSLAPMLKDQRETGWPINSGPSARR